MRWIKLGHIFTPAIQHPKLLTHAANPLAVHLEGDVYRVFFSGRDAQNRSSVGYVDIDMVGRKVTGVCDAPLFEHGETKGFYSHGVSIGNCYNHAGKRYILFMGWHIPDGGHWRGEVGRLELSDALQLRLTPPTLFMPIDADDPISLSYPWVMTISDGSLRMWYGTTHTWDAGNGEMVHTIHQASSLNGEVWHKEGLAIPCVVGKAQAFSRPTVWRDKSGCYHMWYSVRSGDGTPYRIGYAYSSDGKIWQARNDDAGIDVASDGWDANMICYPFVFEHKNHVYMLYNGDGFGKTGFGLAVLDND